MIQIIIKNNNIGTINKTINKTRKATGKQQHYQKNNFFIKPNDSNH